jgi:hypothetical protein
MGGGNNAGMRVAAGRYFFLLNSDAWVLGDGLDRLVARGVPRIVIDPRPDNSRAIRAYEKAGFVPQHEIVTPDGPALLMMLDA